MKLKSILGKVGEAVLSSVVPGGSLILDMVNEFLPKDKKVSKTATGTEIEKAINSLPLDQKTKLLEKELDIEVEEVREWTKVINALSKADEAGSSTRPIIAKMMAYVVCFAIVLFVSVWSYAILYSEVDTLKQLQEAWPLMLTVLATPTALLRAYFGMRTKEKKSRYGILSKQPDLNSGLFNNIVSIFKK